MTARTPVTEFTGEFSEPGAAATPWETVDKALWEAEMFWLSTVRRTGAPHVTPLPAIWHDGVLYFCSGSTEQKTVNLERNPHCVLTTGTNTMRSGLDVVVEGAAERVLDHELLVTLAGVWKSKLDWDYTVGADAYDDGFGHIGYVFGVTPVKVLSFHKAPYAQTRYRFS
jgi:general stress protein 26